MDTKMKYFCALNHDPQYDEYFYGTSYGPSIEVEALSMEFVNDGIFIILECGHGVKIHSGSQGIAQVSFGVDKEILKKFAASKKIIFEQSIGSTKPVK